MKLSINIKEEDKSTTYTMDLMSTEIAVKLVKGKVENFLKETFKKVTDIKEEK